MRGQLSAQFVREKVCISHHIPKISEVEVDLREHVGVLVAAADIVLATAHLELAVLTAQAGLDNVGSPAVLVDS